ncbi:putative membrane protein [Collimonas pratensis]|uniref:Membrane protein n=1 Tax=Collimonas pratensis TaxID=279113 RepID=A0A127Q7L8_9BURK|nr:putative membrane protein [Collimonas pratensis]AMP15969.1 putative membrane protein [Collimonas pratensis]
MRVMMDLAIDGMFVGAIVAMFIVTWALAVGCKKLEDGQ